MYSYYRHLLSSLLCFIVLFSGQSKAFSQSNDDLVDRLRTRYDAVELMRADFTQQTTSPFGEKMPSIKVV